MAPRMSSVDLCRKIPVDPFSESYGECRWPGFGRADQPCVFRQVSYPFVVRAGSGVRIPARRMCL